MEIRTLQLLLPVGAAFYYLLACGVNVISRAGTLGTAFDSRFAERWNRAWAAMIMLTYGIEALSLFGASFVWQLPISDDDIVFASASLLLWTTLLLSFSEGNYGNGFPSWGCWIMYLVGETMLLRRHVRAGWSPLPEALIQTIRLVALCLLCPVPVLQWLANFSCSRNSGQNGETEPLLSDSSSSDTESYEAVRRNSSEHEATNGDPTERGEGAPKSLRILKCIVRFCWPSGKPLLQLLYVGIVLCLAVDRALNILVPMQLGIIADILSSEKRLPWREILVFVVLRFLESGGGMSTLRSLMWMPLDSYTYRMVNTVTFNKIMDLSSDFHSHNSSGVLWQSVYRDAVVPKILRSILLQISPLIADLMLAVGFLHVVFGPYMALVVCAIIVFFLWASRTIQSKQTMKQGEWITASGKEHTIMYDATVNWQTVSYLNRIEYEKKRFASAVKDQVRAHSIFKTWTHAESTVQSFILTVGLLAASLLASHPVSNGTRPIGSFVMLLSYWGQLSGPLRYVSSEFNSFVLDLISADEYVAFLKRQPSISDRPGARPLRVSNGHIRFEDVKFSYDGRRQVLKGITFEATCGKKVALVGETGGGKSTILKLLLRFYDPSSGTIQIDGQDVRDVRLESLREHIGVVPQDPVLFNDSIMNNIRYANLSATDEQIYEACKAVAIHDNIINFPEGYNTIIGEYGIRLSGGELQRLAIARALVKSPALVVLDEATSAVDTETEKHIQAGLAALGAGRTTLVIAHRLSTVMNADMILVIRRGEIVERGTHQELLHRKGYYHSLWAHQTKVSGGSKSRLKPDAKPFVPGS